MKISEVTTKTLCDYIHPADENDLILPIILDASKSYVSSYTGLSLEELDEYEDVTVALLVLCSDMYDNRAMTVDKSNVNKVVDSILGMHCINLL